MSVPISATIASAVRRGDAGDRGGQLMAACPVGPSSASIAVRELGDVLVEEVQVRKDPRR